jgi:hypothetical protein
MDSSGCKMWKPERSKKMVGIKVGITEKELVLNRRGYLAGLLENMPYQFKWVGHGKAAISIAHWAVEPLELWMRMYGGRVEPRFYNNRFLFRIRNVEIIQWSLIYLQNHCVFMGPQLHEAIKELNRCPPVVFEEAYEDIDRLTDPTDKTYEGIHYDGVAQEDIIYQRLGYCASVLERTRQWWRWDNGHITISMRHYKPEPLNMIARIAQKPGGPDPARDKWVLTMNNQTKIHRFLTIMKDFVIIPETKETINLLLEGKEPKKVVDMPRRMCYTLTEAGKRAVGILA